MSETTTASTDVTLTFKRTELLGIAMNLSSSGISAMLDERFNAAAISFDAAAKFYDAVDYRHAAAEKRDAAERARTASRACIRDQFLAGRVG